MREQRLDNRETRARYPHLPVIHKEKEKGAKRKRNDYYYDCYPPRQGGPFPAIKVGHTGLTNTVHPSVVQRHELTEGDEVILTTRRGAARFRVKVTSTIRADTIFVPFHWGGEQAANLLTNPALDPISRMPEFKVCAVRIEPPAINHKE